MPTNQTYHKNYLTDVICRIDFPPILELLNDTPKDFQKLLSEDFPILEPVRRLGVRIEGKDTNITTEKLDSTVWRFLNKDKNTQIELTSEFLAIVSKQYTDFSSFKSIVEKVFNSFYELFPATIVNRLGLRYINQLHFDEENVFEWDDYLVSELTSHLEFVSDKSMIRRSLQAMELAIDEETRLTFRYGMFNSSYPSQIINKEFVLDFDCFAISSLLKDDLLSNLSKFNQITTDYFEKSIKNNLRSKLNAN